MNASLTTTGDDLRMSLYYHDLYTDGIHPDARFPRERYRRIRERLGARTEGPRVRIREAPAATRDEIVVAHDATYVDRFLDCLLYTSPSPRDATLSRMPSSA